MKKRVAALLLAAVFSISSVNLSVFAEGQTDSGTEEVLDTEDSTLGMTDAGNKTIVNDGTVKPTDQKMAEDQITAENQKSTEDQTTTENQKSTENQAAENPTDAQKLQARIDALPDADALEAMTSEGQSAVYEELCSIYDAIDVLEDTDGLDVDKLEAVAQFFTAQIMTLDEPAGQSDSLPEAVNGVITLIQDVTLTAKFVINEDQNITIDLNGHTLTGPADNYTIDNLGTLKIQDSGASRGKIIGVAPSSSCIRNYNQLEVGTVTVESAYVALKNEENSTMKVDGATIISTYQKADTGAILNWGTATIKNTTVKASDAGAAVFASSGADAGCDSKTVIESSDLSGKYPIRSKKYQSSDKTTQTVTIIGGKLRGTVYFDSSSKADAQGEIEVDASAVKYVLEKSTKDTTVILTENVTNKDITIPEDVTLKIPSGVTLNVGNTRKLVVNGTLDASEGSLTNANVYVEETKTYYPTLSRTLKLIDEGQNVKILADLEESSAPTVLKGKKVIIDLNGHSVTSSNGFVINAGSNTTITDTSENKAGEINGTITNNAVLTIEEGKFSVAPVTSEGATTYLNGGKYPVDNIENVIIPDGKELVSNGDGTYSLKEKEVAKIGNTIYSSLQKAIDAANGDEIVVLLKDTQEDIVIPADKNITLDLNGNTLTNVKDHTITNKGTLTIMDSSNEKTGTVDNITHAKAAVVNEPGGTVTLDGGSYTRSKENGSSSTDNGGNSYYTLVNHGTMTINENVKVTQDGSFSSMIENGWYNGNENTNGVSSVLTINGGSFSGGLNTVKNDDYGELTINGGKFTNTSQAVVLNWNTAQITGGEFSTSSGVGILNKYGDDTMDKGSLEITGGTFNITSGKVIISSDKTNSTTTIKGGTFKSTGELFDLENSDATVVVYGGNFSKKLMDEYCAPGFMPTTLLANGMYSVKLASAGDETSSSSSSSSKKKHHSKSDDTEEVNASVTQAVTSAKTGDSTNVWLPVVFLALACAGLGGFWFQKKVRHVNI